MRNLKANNIKLEKKLDKMTHELNYVRRDVLFSSANFIKEENLDEESRET